MNILSRKQGLPVNTTRRVNSNQIKHPVIVSPHGRAPVISTNAPNLNSQNVPTSSAAHVINPLQRKVG